MKRGQLNKAYQARFFALTSTDLHYFKSEAVFKGSSRTSKGSVSLRNAQVWEETSSKDDSLDGLHFCITDRDSDRKLHMKFPAAEVGRAGAKEWVDAITEVCNRGATTRGASPAAGGVGGAGAGAGEGDATMLPGMPKWMERLPPDAGGVARASGTGAHITAAALTDEEDEREVWWFADDSGELQGPFPLVNMRCWFGQGYFERDMKVAYEHEGKYQRVLADVFQVEEETFTFIPSDMLPRPAEDGRRSAASVKEAQAVAAAAVALVATGDSVSGGGGGGSKIGRRGGALIRQGSSRRQLGSPGSSGSLVVDDTTGAGEDGLPAGWEKMTDDSSDRVYYYNAAENITAWDLPGKEGGEGEAEEELEEWHFKDAVGDVQGPFQLGFMRAWFEAGYFESSMLVRVAPMVGFIALNSMYPEEVGELSVVAFAFKPGQEALATATAAVEAAAVAFEAVAAAAAAAVGEQMGGDGVHGEAQARAASLTRRRVTATNSSGRVVRRGSNNSMDNESVMSDQYSVGTMSPDLQPSFPASLGGDELSLDGGRPRKSAAPPEDPWERLQGAVCCLDTGPPRTLEPHCEAFFRDNPTEAPKIADGAFLCGFVNKQGRFLHSWRSRFFVLIPSPPHLRYFDVSNPRKPSLKGQMSLRDAKISVVGGESFDDIEGEGKEGEKGDGAGSGASGALERGGSRRLGRRVSTRPGAGRRSSALPTPLSRRSIMSPGKDGTGAGGEVAMPQTGAPSPTSGGWYKFEVASKLENRCLCLRLRNESEVRRGKRGIREERREKEREPILFVYSCAVL